MVRKLTQVVLLMKMQNKQTNNWFCSTGAPKQPAASYSIRHPLPEELVEMEAIIGTRSRANSAKVPSRTTILFSVNDFQLAGEQAVFVCAKIGTSYRDITTADHFHW